MSYEVEMKMGGVSVKRWNGDTKVQADFHANKLREVRHFPPTEERDREFYILEFENHEGTEFSLFADAETLAGFIEKATEALAGPGVKVLIEV